MPLIHPFCTLFFSHICLLFSFLSFPSIFNTNFKHIPINREDNIMNPYVPINHLQQWSFCQPGFDYSLLLSLLNILRKLISFLPHQNELCLYVCLLFIFASSNRRTYKGFNMVSEKKNNQWKIIILIFSLFFFSLYFDLLFHKINKLEKIREINVKNEKLNF